MKWTLQLILLLALACNAEGQDHYKVSTAYSESPVNIALDEIQEIFVAPPVKPLSLKSAKASDPTFKVTFVNFPEEAKEAFYYALSIWEDLISSPLPIHIEAHWQSLEGGILAKGNPAIFYNNFSGAPIPNVYYPVALAEKLSGKELNAGAPDIVCRFSSRFKWYFGTDGNTPSTHYDFVSSALHEITHGLGFSGFLNESNGKGYFNNNNGLPSIYDYFLFNNDDQQISDKSLFQSPSSDLYRQITSENVKFCQASSSPQEQKLIDWIFAPKVWNDGTSIYHLKGYEYGEENGLMTPFAVKGRAIHNPGDVTMAILAELGWESVRFEFNQLKDLEYTVAELPFSIKINADKENNFSSVTVIYSNDGFTTAKFANLKQVDSSTEYTGTLAIDNNTGKIQYYIEAKNMINQVYRLPSEAPSALFALNIGPDYSIPNLFHNPVKLLAGMEKEVNLLAEVTDNIGISTVKIDYKLNGVLQEPVFMECSGKDMFAANIPLKSIGKTDRVEYKITATDNSSRKNKRSFPAIGFQEVIVFSAYEPVKSYSSNFESGAQDFAFADFTVSQLSGMKGNILHTVNPYPVSAFDDEKYNMIAQLKYPIIIRENGYLSFDEIVLVEPGQNGLDIWDYVIVEASINGGKDWLPISEKYNSVVDNNWYSAFKKSFSGNTSTAMPHESMFVNHTINLTQNTGLVAGDIAIFRFRLASDNSVNGFGWAIDNLEIQGMKEEKEELLAESRFQLYPNPASSHLFIEWAEDSDNKPVEITVTDLVGKIIRRETGIEPLYNPKTRIDLSGIQPGIYMVSINEGMKITSTKIIKN
jgi:hypothetical protein